MWKVRTKDFWMEELPSGFWRICVDGKKAILTRPDLIVDRDDLVLGVWLFSQQFLLCWENADGSWTIVAEEEPDWEEWDCEERGEKERVPRRYPLFFVCLILPFL